MPDITMCKGTGCELKDKCYRFKAKPDKHWQSYFVNPPIKDGNCVNFWLDDTPSKPRKERKKK